MLEIFSYLSQDEIDSSSKVNHGWRDCIQSDLFLFISIEVKNTAEFYDLGQNPDPWWDEEDKKLEGMRMTIGTLSRLASLSNNRLKQVLIGLAAFGGCMPKSAGGWRFSRLSVVFDILTLSSHTLTKLQLDFPRMLYTVAAVKASGKYIQVIIAKLSLFSHLREVELRLLPSNLEVISQSKSRKLTLSSYSHGWGEDYWCQFCQHNKMFSNCDADEISALLPLDRVIRDINAFTGGQVSHLASTSEENWKDFSPWLNPEVENEIQGSFETLEKLEVQDFWSIPLELPFLVVRCPQLTSFKLYCDLDYQEMGNESWRVDLPLEAVRESKLKTLAIWIERGPALIIINESMLKWVGFSLETVLVNNHLGLAPFGEALQLCNLVRNVSLTLSSLTIESFYNSTTLMETLSGSTATLFNLRKLDLVGNAGLINMFISAFDYASLTHLKLRKDSGAEDRVEVDKVYKLVRETSGSLEVLHLSGWFNESTIEGSKFEPMDFPNLIKLSLCFPFESETGPFSRSKLPKLKTLELFGTLQPLRHRFSSVLSQLDVE